MGDNNKYIVGIRLQEENASGNFAEKQLALGFSSMWRVIHFRELRDGDAFQRESRVLYGVLGIVGAKTSSSNARKSAVFCITHWIRTRQAVKADLKV